MSVFSWLIVLFIIKEQGVMLFMDVTLYLNKISFDESQVELSNGDTKLTFINVFSIVLDVVEEVVVVSCVVVVVIGSVVVVIWLVDVVEVVVVVVLVDVLWVVELELVEVEDYAIEYLY